MTQFVVVQSGYQIESQPVTTPTVAIPLRHDAKDFHMPYHVLHHDALTRQLPIGLLLRWRQLSTARFLGRRARVCMFLVQTLITAICQHARRGGNLAAHVLEHRKIMPATARLASADYFARVFVDYYLRLYRVSLLLARIVPPLFFFGRSISDSVASTTMTSIRLSLSGRNAFLPSNAKSGESFKMFSSLVIVRHTVGSLTAHDLAMWNCVRYSRQYSSIINIWSSIESLHGLPGFFCVRPSSRRTNSHIRLKVRGLTPQ